MAAAEAHVLDLGPTVAIVGIAVGAVVASSRLRLGTVLGYLAAGVLVGPSVLGLFEEVSDVQHVSEIGVVLLLFVIGLELQPSRLKAMARDTLGLGGAQVAITALVATPALMLAGFGLGAAATTGFALALSSTAMALQLANERRELGSEQGRKAFGILLFQDLAVIPALVIVSLVGSGEVSLGPLLAGLVGAALLVGFGRRLLGAYFRIVAGARSRELFTIGALLAVVAIAWFMYVAGLSMGLGAFLAGVVLSRSEFRHELETVIDPFKGVLLGLFFLAVGMSIELGLLRALWLPALLGIAALFALKFSSIYALGRAFGAAHREALKLAGLVWQGGEFAFVILAQAGSNGLLENRQAALVTLIVIGSMILTPLVLKLVDALAARSQAAPERAVPDAEEHHPRVVIAGFGRFGQIIARVLASQNIAFTALDKDPSQVDFVRRFGNEIFFGDATRLDLLRTAHVDRAQVLAIAIDDVEDSVRLARLARAEFPALAIVARARNRFHAYRLIEAGVEHVFRETYGSSLEATDRVLRSLGLQSSAASRAIRLFRQHDEAILRDAAPHHGDMEQLIAIAKQGREELHTLFERDEEET